VRRDVGGLRRRLLRRCRGASGGPVLYGPDSDWIHLPDPIADAIKGLSARLGAIEERLAALDGKGGGEVTEIKGKQGRSSAGG
jgi:serine O-acetyltransferase